MGATLAAAREVLNVAPGANSSSRSAADFARRDVTAEGSRASATGWNVAANLAGGTHHAFRDRGEGYCVFNDVAVAAAVLLRDGIIARAAVVDCDVHQGNGTAAIFRDEPAVFTFSLHGWQKFFGAFGGLDLTFADSAGDDDTPAALADHLPRARSYRPDVVYLAGADPYEGDRLGRLKRSIEGLRTRDQLVFDTCRERGIPIAIAMSGGYAPDVDAIVTIHCNTIREAVRSCQSAFVC